MPTISVIVPVYMVEPYLRQCVDSILNQTFRDFELILVDDGSPDHCGAICDEYAAKDSRVRVIHKVNGGLSSARNAGLDTATGDYIAFVDSDDWVQPGFLEELLRAMQNEQADLILCGAKRVWDGNMQMESYPLPDRSLCREEALQLLIQGNWLYIVAWNKLYRRKLFDGVRFPNGYIHEDEAVFHKIIANCERIAMIKEELYLYRQSEDSIMRREFNIHRTDMLTVLAERIEFSFRKNWTDVWNNAATKFVDMFFNYYFRFPRTKENEKYFRRMDNSLKIALPYVWKARGVSVHHKIYLTLIRIDPRLYLALRRILSG